MHCPKCGQQQLTDETRFCSRCGFLLTGIAEVISNNGIIPGQSLEISASSSPKKRGLKQGLFIFLTAFLIVPLVVVLSIGIHIGPGLSVFTAILISMVGLLRMAYALMFESGVAGEKTLEQNVFAASQNLLNKNKTPLLPAEQSVPASAYAPPSTGMWLDTNELAPHPGSVTDSTTKLLHKEEDQ